MLPEPSTSSMTVGVMREAFRVTLVHFFGSIVIIGRPAIAVGCTGSPQFMPLELTLPPAPPPPRPPSRCELPWLAGRSLLVSAPPHAINAAASPTQPIPTSARCITRPPSPYADPRRSLAEPQAAANGCST